MGGGVQIDWEDAALNFSQMCIYLSIVIALFVVVVTVSAMTCSGGDGVIMRHCATGGMDDLRAAAKEAAAAAAATSEQAPLGGECWICLSSSNAEGEGLIRGCACRGTAGWVHLQCLVNAAEHKPTMWNQCPSCKQQYTGYLLLKLSRTRWEQVRPLPLLSPVRLNAANMLCLALNGCGEAREAAAVVESTLSTCEALLGPDHPQTLTALNNLAQSYQSCGELDKAARLAERAVAGYRKTLGNEHANTLQTLNNLGGLLMMKGNLDEAAALLEESLVGHRKVLGEEHRNTVNCLHNLAGLHAEQGEFEKSIELLKVALRGSSRTLGDEHPQTKATAHSLQQLEDAQGASMRIRRAQRIEFSEEVLELRQQVMWPDRPLSYSAVEGDETEAQHFGIHARITTHSLFWGTKTVETLVSVVSVWLSADGSEAQFRKFCTSTEMQRKGLGVELLTYALASLRKRSPPIRRVWCNARVEQVGFYGKHFGEKQACSALLPGLVCAHVAWQLPSDRCLTIMIAVLVHDCVSGLQEIEGSQFEKGGREYVLMERRYEDECAENGQRRRRPLARA